MLKPGEQWRLYDRFRDSAAFLDIETDGLERDSTVTVLTVHRGRETHTLVNGENLSSESLSEALEGASMPRPWTSTRQAVPCCRTLP